MHESSVTRQIVQTVLQEAEKQGAKKVLEVNLVIGKLSLLGLEQVRFVYKIFVKGTIMEDSKLLIEERDVLVKCASCGYEGQICFGDPSGHSLPTAPIITLQCPKCEGSVEIVEGRECLIKNLKLLGPSSY
jgi:hydrogenase nickel incorporation protein HypA/HybF